MFGRKKKSIDEMERELKLVRGENLAAKKRSNVETSLRNAKSERFSRTAAGKFLQHAKNFGAEAKKGAKALQARNEAKYGGYSATTKTVKKGKKKKFQSVKDVAKDERGFRSSLLD